MKTSLFLLAALAPTALAAQSYHLPADTPGTGVCDANPFGGDTRYQVLIPPTDLGGGPLTIRGFAIAPCTTGTTWFWRITVRMAHLSSATLSTTFDINLAAGAVTVFDGNLFAWPTTADTWNEVDMQRPFAFNGRDHLVVDVVTQGVSGAAFASHAATAYPCVVRTNYAGEPTGIDAGRSAFKMRITSGDAGAQVFGQGCRGSLGTPSLALHGQGRLGTQCVVSATISSLAPTSATLFVGDRSHGGLPYELGQLGAPGCFVYTWPFTTLNASTQSGVAWVTLQVPSDLNLVGVVLYFQWLVRDRAGNALGYTTSAYGRVRLGS